jgi:hypothetical protein
MNGLLDIEDNFNSLLLQYFNSYNCYKHTPKKYYKVYGILMRSNDIESIQLVDVKNKKWLMSIKDDNTLWYHSDIFLKAHDCLGINHSEFISLLRNYVEKNFGKVIDTGSVFLGGSEFNQYVDEIIQQDEQIKF